MWVTSDAGEFILYENDDDYDTGNTLKLMSFRNGRVRLNLTLSNCTEEELLALWTFFDNVFHKALPICRERDEVAQRAFDNGDDSFARLYRAVPRLVIRERPSSQHDEVLRVGPEGVSGLAQDDDGGDLDFDRPELREPSDEVAEPVPPDRGSVDNGTQAHNAESLRQVGWADELFD